MKMTLIALSLTSFFAAPAMAATPSWNEKNISQKEAV
ncbi:hypothetical protein VTH8203_03599 [Vibrio thalassae]|uniref:Uncharacterized protein n=1 Tax=Vibrio thalassae TaxID=1243014 RepID=A0A240EN77_9VIBR|nr:hypothetical protein VTH8203_03599 [Vibrio thalassae]